MADLDLGGTVVQVIAPDVPVFVVQSPSPSLSIVVPVQGPQGTPGPAGDNSGQPRYYGNGAPGTIIGAQPGDLYLDLLTGTIYELT